MPPEITAAIDRNTTAINNLADRIGSASVIPTAAVVAAFDASTARIDGLAQPTP